MATTSCWWFVSDGVIHTHKFGGWSSFLLQKNIQNCCVLAGLPHCQTHPNTVLLVIYTNCSYIQLPVAIQWCLHIPFISHSYPIHIPRSPQSTPILGKCWECIPILFLLSHDPVSNTPDCPVKSQFLVVKSLKNNSYLFCILYPYQIPLIHHECHLNPII